MDYKEHNKKIDEQTLEVLKKKEELLELLDLEETKLKELYNSKRYDTKITFLDGTEDIISNDLYNNWRFIKQEITKRYGHRHFKAFDIDENKEHNFYSKKHPENLFITILSIDDKVKEYLKDEDYRTLTNEEKKFKTGGRLYRYNIYHNDKDFAILELNMIQYKVTIEKRTPKTILVNDIFNPEMFFRKTIKQHLGFEYIEYEEEDYLQIVGELDCKYILVKF